MSNKVKMCVVLFRDALVTIYTLMLPGEESCAALLLYNE